MPPEVNEAARLLVNKTFRPLGLGFQESAIGVIVTNKYTYYSRVLTSGSKVEMSDAVFVELKVDLEKKIHEIEGDRAIIRRVSLLHSHPGQDRPLSNLDYVAFRRSKPVQDFYRSFGHFGAEFGFYAVPEQKKGDLVFGFTGRSK